MGQRNQEAANGTDAASHSSEEWEHDNEGGNENVNAGLLDHLNRQLHEATEATEASLLLEDAYREAVEMEARESFAAIASEIHPTPVPAEVLQPLSAREERALRRQMAREHWSWEA